MYENLLHQNASNQLISDFKNNQLPGAILFNGPAASGKLTAALETARILSCTGKNLGHWLCDCAGCKAHKAMVNSNLILVGPRDCTPEISAASATFIKALSENASYLSGARYFFVRSIRKLTLRFNPVLIEGSKDISKIAVILSTIEEELEPLDFPHELPDFSTCEKACKKIVEQCKKLEENFMDDSVLISRVRNISSWSRLKSYEGKKTIIIENADRMLEGARNALLKILEEPPADTVFILTTTKRNAIMPTILSRVRSYNFYERTLPQQKEVLTRVFHENNFEGSIDEYLLTFLPVSPEEIRIQSKLFFISIANGTLPDLQGIIKNCGNFDPRILFKIFLDGIIQVQKSLLNSPAGTQASVEIVKAVHECWNDVSIFNQSILSSLELLLRNMSKINKLHGGIFLSCANS